MNLSQKQFLNNCLNVIKFLYLKSWVFYDYKLIAIKDRLYINMWKYIRPYPGSLSDKYISVYHMMLSKITKSKYKQLIEYYYDKYLNFLLS